MTSETVAGPTGEVADVVRILHLSDTHFLAEGRHNGVDTLAATERVLAACSELEPPDVVVVSGDVSEDGTPESYELARSVIGSWAHGVGAPAIFAVGNHDRRAPFRAVLGDGHLASFSDIHGDAEEVRHGPRTDAPVDGVSIHDGLRVVTLDTSVPGAGRGELAPASLAWLREVLAEPAPRGTVIVLHHPPLHPATRLHEAIRLRRPEALVEAVTGTDVRVMLAGHYHHAMTGVLSGIPVVVTPGVTNRTETLVRYGTERAVRGSAATLVELGPGANLTVTPQVVTHLQDGEPVLYFDEAAVEALILDQPA
ncbi:metallophosphoesterase [Georgenia alba]|uniref:Metallophosphoesterase n=1 Tax=Georgenia alba TaxID=2233858 RepID=A0ABW2Q3I6_9MICO